MSPMLRDLERDKCRAQCLLDEMARTVREIDPIAAAQFDAAGECVEHGVFCFSLGPGNPYPAEPAYRELGGEA